jgi:uncharacterized protein
MEELTGNDLLSMKKSILITGGTGLIGRNLTNLLLDKGFNVTLLSRKKKKHGKVKICYWEPETRKIDLSALQGIDYIIHLAGANIGEERWTRKRKQEIISSRSGSARLLFKSVTESGIKLKGYISASATGIYGMKTSNEIYNETDPPADDFLGHVCTEWEAAADLFSASGIRTVKIRTGVVLDKNDAALSKLMMPGKFGFLVKMGTGRQYMPWIHLADLCEIYFKAISDNTMNGAYNAVAPQHITHGDFMSALGSVMHKAVLPVSVPGIILRLFLGEMSDVVMKGSRVSSDKIQSAGFEFRYKTVEQALLSILR